MSSSEEKSEEIIEYLNTQCRKSGNNILHEAALNERVSI